MLEELRPVPIQELRIAPDRKFHWNLDHHLPQLDSLTKVRGQIVALHLGNALEVQGAAETIVTLCCDRCLQPYNHVLRCAVQELIWLGGDNGSARVGGAEAPPPDFDVDGLSERLDPRGAFDPAAWIFEQLHLQLPLVNRCGAHCPGPAQPPQNASAGKSAHADSAGPRIDATDPRWAPLARIRNGQKPQEPCP